MLQIYSASAGSGKTHLLTSSYLKLLLSDNADFRRILAVTFTNKATDEMKNRIVEELYKIAVSPERSAFLKSIGNSELIARYCHWAQRALPAILHDYSSFAVSTIDKFFQQVLRAFTREIGVNEGYTLELDTNKSLEIIIDRIYASLGEKENTDLLNRLIEFSENKLEEGASWNVKRDLFSLAEELFKETFRTHQTLIRAEIEDKEKLESFRKELKAIQRDFREKLKAIGEEALKLMAAQGLRYSDFKGASNAPFRVFHAFAQSDVAELKDTFVRLYDNLDGWKTQKTEPSTAAAIEQAYHAGLNRCIGDVLKLYDTEIVSYNTAVEIDRNFFRLALLGDISRHLSAYAEEKNLLFIQDTTELLNRIVGKADTPFIYEKTGTKIDHYMIDEFQDTSNMQWQNFLPLLKESLSAGKENLLVGDVKQSIYRFRNSDWRLLSEKIDKDLSHFPLRRSALRQNWRSKQEIVAFNNRLWGWVKRQANDELAVVGEAYIDVQQEVALPRLCAEGYIRLSFIEDLKEARWREVVKARLPHDLEQLQAQGIPLGEIGILVRRNCEAKEVAQLLLGYRQQHPESPYRFDIVSDEALEVASSKAVQLLLAAFGYLANPGSETAGFRLLLLREQLKRQRSAAVETTVVGISEPKEDKSFLTALRRTQGNSLYELAENLLATFAELFGKGDQIFLQSFLDIVLEFGSRDNQELTLFLEWWENSGQKRKIAIPDAQDAIRIMTIHKSKGLEFKHVIIPFCDWKTDLDASKENILWCRPSAEPFNEFTFLPVKYGKKLADTIFEEAYQEEKKYAFIDNLNALYVALTRAKEQMIVYAPRPKKTEGKEFSTVSALLYGCFGGELEGDTSDICFGQPEPMGPHKETEAKEREESLPLRPIGKGKRLRLRLKRTFSAERQTDKRGYGIFMHRVLSRIKNSGDLENTVTELVDSGDLSPEKTADLLATLKEKITHPIARKWFETDWEVLPEQPILSQKGVKIPDRILLNPTSGEVEVVDYKFGEKEEERYRQQVKTYCDLLAQMGYTPIKGYLWYVQLNKIVEVEQ